MSIAKIELYNFRNYHKEIFSDLKKINMIIGDNGIGKTSILESIYICSIGKSFRTNNDFSIINNDSLNYKIKIKIKDNKIINNLEFLYNPEGKKTFINKNLTKRLSDFIGMYKVILFSPDEIKIIKGSPRYRRNYFDIEISQINREYIKYLKDYNILIKNKNEYLKQLQTHNVKDINFLDILDKKIVTIGKKIYNLRKEYIENINNYIKKFDNKLKINLNYESDFNEEEEKILSNLKRIRKKEIILGMTSFGIHRDDILFLNNEKDAKEYSSQGQLKMIMLFLKFSEVEMFIEKYGYKPILLLDDLFSELDIANQNYIIDNLSKKTQIFITNTSVKQIKNKKKINIIDLNERVKNNERK